MTTRRTFLLSAGATALAATVQAANDIVRVGCIAGSTRAVGVGSLCDLGVQETTRGRSATASGLEDRSEAG